MPEIGPTLRETRMRQGLEISDIEASTKIRAKYLRAIENEEWDLLPGPTFVKSFLRTYAEALDLDSRLLLEEYKSRYERFDEHEVRPTAAPRATSHSSSGRERRPPRRGHPGRWILLACLAMVAAIVFFLLGSGDDTPQRKGVTSPVTEASTTSTEARTTRTTDEPARTTKKADTTPATRKTVKLRIVPTGEVYACLFAGSKRLIAGQTLTAGTPTDTYKSKRFVVVLGNGDATLDVDGTSLDVPQSDKPIGYEVTSAGRKRIAAGDLPTC